MNLKFVFANEKEKTLEIYWCVGLYLFFIEKELQESIALLLNNLQFL